MARPSLSSLIESQRRQLVATALSGGLSLLRRRSPPDRVAREADRWVSMLGVALAGKPVRLAATVADEVRTGAFAGAEGEVPKLFALWRQTLETFAVSTIGSGVQARRVRTALDALERAVVEELREWSEQRFDLIVIGASAGGVQALRTVLGALQTDLAATVLLVLHVADRTPGVLPIVLAGRTELQVAYALHGSRLYLGHAYVAPPGRHLVAAASSMQLNEAPRLHHVRPSVDVLFASAARAHGRRVISVVLSGTGQDGAAGTELVRDAGGMTLCEDPSTAQFAGMPAAAVASGAVGYVLPLDKLGPAINQLVAGGNRKRLRG